jgi:hypothetical protein
VHQVDGGSEAGPPLWRHKIAGDEKDGLGGVPRSNMGTAPWQRGGAHWLRRKRASG